MWGALAARSAARSSCAGWWAVSPTRIDIPFISRRRRPLELQEEPGDFAIPEGIEFARIDANTGKLAGPSSKRAFNAAFLAGSTPGEEEAPQELADVELDEGDAALDYQDPGALELLR